MAATDEMPGLAADDSESTANWIAGRVMHGGVYLFTIAILGLIGALLLGSFDHRIRQWGWAAGAAIAAVGYPLGWVRFDNLKIYRKSDSQLQKEAQERGEPYRPLPGALLGLALGAISGIILWFVICVFWVSLALSPLTPDSWREGFAVGVGGASLPMRPGFIILGCTTGSLALLGAVAGLCGKIYPSGSSPKRRGDAV